ncbi:MAG: M48 family metalloprotease [Gammaproteobacteria bacterium]|nr:M48 family metalloprotease [Gammaproteobacteria bacterium]
MNPATGKNDFVLMSEKDEIELGSEAHAQIVRQFGGAYEDPALQDYARRVGERIAANSHRKELSYHFTVLDSSEVNAFALPGGYIYITRGLLAYLNSEAELAAVLGHEIGHVTARHSVRQISGTRAAQIGYTIGSVLLPELGNQIGQGLFNVLGGAITSGYGREHELEADRLGAGYLARSGYDPRAMLKVLEVLKNQEVYERQLATEGGRQPKIYHGVFASHPSSDKRLQEAVAYAEQDSNAAPEETHELEDYPAYLDGLVYGDSERAGVVRGEVFYHADLGIGFTLPAQWSSENFPERLVLQSPTRDAVLQVSVEGIEEGQAPREFVRSRNRSRTVQREDVLELAGLETYSAIIEGGTATTPRPERASVIYHQALAYLFVGVGKNREAFERYDADFVAVARSFHPLSETEQGLAAALRIRLLRVDGDLDFAGLAQQSPLAAHPEEQLRLLNQLYPDGVPAPGSLLKIIQ